MLRMVINIFIKILGGKNHLSVYIHCTSANLNWSYLQKKSAKFRCNRKLRCKRTNGNTTVKFLIEATKSNQDFVQ